jgi:hypothetical protein
MQQDNVVRLPNLEEQIWADLESRMRSFWLSVGVSTNAIDEVVASVKRRCEGMPIKTESVFPADLSETVRDDFVKFISHFAGFMIGRIVEVEVELYNLKQST